MIRAGILTFGLGTQGSGDGGGTVIVQDILATVTSRETVYGFVSTEESVPTAIVTVEPLVVSGCVTVATGITGIVESSQDVIGVVREDCDPMSVPTNNVEMFLGDNRTLDVLVNDNEGNPVDITGAKMWFTAKAKLSDPDEASVLSKKNTAAGGSDAEITFTDAANGVAEVYIVPADGDGVDASQYSYDIQVTLANGKTYTIVRAKIKFKKGATLEKA